MMGTSRLVLTVWRSSHFSSASSNASVPAPWRTSSSSRSRPCHIERFCESRLSASTLRGTSCVSATKNGATMKSMKLRLSSVCSVVSRSQAGDTGRPSAFSRSPCAKNSSMTTSLHFLLRRQGLAGLLMSAMWHSAFRKISRSSGATTNSLRTPSGPLLAVDSADELDRRSPVPPSSAAGAALRRMQLSRSSLRLKCTVMSVAKIAEMTTFRMRVRSSGSKFDVMSDAGRLRIWKASAAWWFSSGEASL
mmetsp:Transcript_19685/g.59613  ORF Transcript_19685/g.59613 Transcript_19685/m.59613 type:complete len:249 (-) Transcript_19685:1148-1894(-)